MFPFTAFVDQEDLKLGLLIAIVNPRVGGVLLTGEKGTGKTTLVRSLAEILPEIEAVKGCPFHCDPYDRSKQCPECRRRENIEIEKIPMRIVELPLGATEEMVLGTINIEKAVREKTISFEMGILGKANRNILYIDEVNLLPDYLVDVILDAAATGWNTVEREGISYSHPAEFILIGSMNPEEGDLRPQLLDRFGLSIEVKPLKDPYLRVEVYRRREDYDRDPERFRKRYEQDQQSLKERVINAREILKDVEIPDEIMLRTSELLIELGVKSNRAEITTFRAASAVAALEGRTIVTWQDIERVVKFAIFHRIPGDKVEEVKKILAEKIENKIEVPQDENVKRNAKGIIDFFVQKIKGDWGEKKS